jgi:translation initiation factor 3 subunit J
MDDWDEDSWEHSASNFKPVTKFVDEDQGEEPEPTQHVIKPQPKKKEEKKWMKEGASENDKPLDDPIEEKMRQQRLIEQSDYVAAKELFKDMQLDSGLDVDKFLPKTFKDYEEYAAAVAAKYILGHKDGKHYKALLKSLIKQAFQPLSVADITEVEACVVKERMEKMKEEKAAAEAKSSTALRKKLNTGGKGKNAGIDYLEDYIYDDAGDGDDDFM